MDDVKKAKEEKRAVKLMRAGARAADAARAVGVHPTTAQKWAHAHGIPLEYPCPARPAVVDKSLIVDLSAETWEDGPLYTLAEIAEIAGCSRGYVKQVRRAARDEGRL